MMNLKKKIAPVLMGGALAVATAVPVFAADAGTSTGLSSVESALTTSFTSIGSSMTSVVGKIGTVNTESILAVNASSLP